VPDPAATCWLHDDVAVGQSNIAGRGLFATAAIPQGMDIARLGGQIRSTAELRVLPAVDSFAVDDDHYLVLGPGNRNRYGNHSCEPNLWWTGQYTLSARRDIATGEELTSDYSTSIADPQFLLRCHCESYRCRQMVTGDDWRIPQLQRAYANHWTPMLQHLIDQL
jgi:SET domain-containing protein